MTIDTTKLRKLAQDTDGYGSCKYAWPHDEHDGVAVVGQIHDGEKYHVAEIDTGQYFADEEAIKLAEFYAAANPATVLALMDELDRLRTDRDHVTSMFEITSHQLSQALELVEKRQKMIDRLQHVEAAARNLAKVKGRHHSELAMNQLLEALK